MQILITYNITHVNWHSIIMVFKTKGLNSFVDYLILTNVQYAEHIIVIYFYAFIPDLFLMKMAHSLKIFLSRGLNVSKKVQILLFNIKHSLYYHII